MLFFGWVPGVMWFGGRFLGYTEIHRGKGRGTEIFLRG